MAEYLELYIDQGSDFSDTIVVNDYTTDYFQNLSNYVVTGQLRRSMLSVNASANLTCSVTDSKNGVMTISMTAANTANLRPGTYVYAIKTRDATGFTSRLVEGVVFVTPGVTM